MDFLFLAIIVAIYFATRGLIWAIARLGGHE